MVMPPQPMARPDPEVNYLLAEPVRDAMEAQAELMMQPSYPPWYDPEDYPDPEEVFLVRITAGLARAFVKRAAQVLEAGRPGCPFCGHPIDPDGHLCVRANGFRRRDP